LLWVRVFISFKYSLFTSLIIVLHPYYKLDYIILFWGGAEEQAMERLGGNSFAKNWQDEALKVVEKTVNVDSQSASPSHTKQQTDGHILQKATEN
jgi:hypothetical protein